MQKKIFVTVGTTQFPKLIESVYSEDIQQTLLDKGYNFIQMQCGKDWKHNPEKISSKISIKVESYFENFQQQILNSDLVISHAGAGTCLEVLRLKKPLIVVINEDLMDNHQIELAEQLQTDGYLYYCTCNQLKDTLQKDLTTLKHYPEPDKNLFANYLDNCMGFVK